AVGLDDHARLRAQRLLPLPEEELLAVALEGDLDEVRHDRNLHHGGSHSVTIPMRRNFSRRRRTSLSGFTRRRSSSAFTSASCSALAAAAWSMCAPPKGSGITSSITPNSRRSDAVMRSACAARSFISGLLPSFHSMAAQPSTVITEYTAFSNIST